MKFTFASRPWSLFDSAVRLCDGADHLLHDHNCDEHGCETLIAARDSMREMLPELIDAQNIADFWAQAHADLERLTAERAALLAPVEGVDVEEVLRLDREGTAGPWRTIPMDCGDYWGVEIVGPDGQPITGETRISAADRDVVERYRTAAPALAREVASLRDHLNTARRLLPPRYVAADGSILDPQRCTPHARDCAECGRGRAHDEECLGVLETPAEEVARLRAELEGARLTLAAEQGRAEGAPSEGWVWAGDERGVWGWRKGGVCIIRYGNGDWGFEMDGRHIFAPNARAAMLAADAATEAR